MVSSKVLAIAVIVVIIILFFIGNAMFITLFHQKFKCFELRTVEVKPWDLKTNTFIGVYSYLESTKEVPCEKYLTKEKEAGK